MKFTINIEETINQEFEVEANSFDEALDIAEQKYKNGEFILDQAYLSAKQMAVTSPISAEWLEF